MIYLRLYHGFKSDEERKAAEGWGEEGPIIGPLEYVHTTYGSHIKCRIAENSSHFQTKYADLNLDIRDGKDFDLLLVDDCIALNGVFYGDWVVFYESKSSSAEREMKQLLTKYFPDWKKADWDFEVQYWDDEIEAYLIHLVVDGEVVVDGDPEDDPHPIYERIHEDVDLLELALNGITEVERNG